MHTVGTPAALLCLAHSLLNHIHFPSHWPGHALRSTPSFSWACLAGHTVGDESRPDSEWTTCSLTCSLIPSLTHLFIHSFSDLLTHSFAHSSHYGQAHPTPGLLPTRQRPPFTVLMARAVGKVLIYSACQFLWCGPPHSQAAKMKFLITEPRTEVGAWLS